MSTVNMAVQELDELFYVKLYMDSVKHLLHILKIHDNINSGINTTINSRYNIFEECAVCINVKPLITFIPCTHRIICIQCYKKLPNALINIPFPTAICPYCKLLIFNVIENFYQNTMNCHLCKKLIPYDKHNQNTTCIKCTQIFQILNRTITDDIQIYN